MGPYLLAFAAGVLAFFTPCTLPVLPAYLAFASQKSEHSTLTRTLLFGAGMMIIFLALGLLAGTVGGFLVAHKRAFSLGAGILLILLGLSLLLGWGRSITLLSKTRAGPFGFGILFALGWSACTGPIVALALVLAAGTGTALSGAFMLFFYAIGLLLPLAVVATLLHRNRALTRLRVKTVRCFGREMALADIIAGTMLLVLGLLFLGQAAILLSQSRLTIGILSIEERLAEALGISLIR